MRTWDVQSVLCGVTCYRSWVVPRNRPSRRGGGLGEENAGGLGELSRKTKWREEGGSERVENRGIGSLQKARNAAASIPSRWFAVVLVGKSCNWRGELTKVVAARLLSSSVTRAQTG